MDDRTYEINEFLKEQIADKLEAAKDAQDRTRKAAIKVLEAGSGLFGLTDDQAVPNLGNYVTWLMLRQLYRKTQDGAYDPAPTDFVRSINQVRTSVQRELVFIAKRNITGMPQDPYAEAELRARMRGYGEFLGDTDRLLMQVKEQFPAETAGADDVKVGGS